jgi:hypothetical protein
MFTHAAIQPIHLCLGGFLCSPVVILVIVLAVYQLRRQRTP